MTATSGGQKILEALYLRVYMPTNSGTVGKVTLAEAERSREMEVEAQRVTVEGGWELPEGTTCDYRLQVWVSGEQLEVW